LENFKILLDAEAKRFISIQDNCDEIIGLFKEAIKELREENVDEI